MRLTVRVGLRRGGRSWRGLPHFVFMALLAGASTATAATKSWTGSVNNLWAVGANWNGGVPPVNGDALFFPAGMFNSDNNLNDMTGLTLSSVTIGPNTYVFSGSPVTLTGGLTSQNGLPTWSLPTTLGASQTFDAGGMSFTSSIDLNGHTLTLVSGSVPGSIVGSGGLVVSERLDLQGTSSFTGTLTVSPSATIRVMGSISNSTLAVGSGAVLSGTGTVATAFLTGATLSPGSFSPGTGTLSTGGLSMQGGTVQEDIFINFQGTSSDRVQTIGTVTLGSPVLQVNVLGGLPAPGQTFMIIDNDGTDPIVGIFAGLPQGAILTAGSTSFQISYSGGSGNDVVLTAVEGGGVIPTSIPTLGGLALLLLAAGLAAIGARLVSN